MPSFFCISVHFLQGAFHGRQDAGRPEWPPSPMRLFQAMVCSAARRWGEPEFADRAAPALKWLEQRLPPQIVAPSGEIGTAYCLSVPNNAMDVVARAWARGNFSGGGDANPATHKTLKTVRPVRLTEHDPLHYLWALPEPLSNEDLGAIEMLTMMAQALSVVGWGFDFVAAHGRVLNLAEANALKGERWFPADDGSSVIYRAPQPGTLRELIDRHHAFLRRLEGGGFRPVPTLGAFRNCGYRRATDSRGCRVAAFQLLKEDASGYRSFDAVRQATVVAGMLRNAAKRSAQAAGWSEERIAAFVLGHGEPNGEPHRPVGLQRFSFIPLPSIESRGGGRAVAGRVRRALVAVMAGGHEDETEWASRAMSGVDLIDEHSGQVSAVLSLIPRGEKMIQRYVRASDVWSTITPLVLPGYDDPNHYRRRLKRPTSAEEKKRLLGQLEARTDGLIRKAIVQGGISAALAEHAQIDWRGTAFWPGCELATRYNVPIKLRRFPRLHVQIRWQNARGEPLHIPGPICLGGGRYVGLGLFAPQ